jgi:hypothetical protein
MRLLLPLKLILLRRWMVAQLLLLRGLQVKVQIQWRWRLRTPKTKTKRRLGKRKVKI